MFSIPPSYALEYRRFAQQQNSTQYENMCGETEQSVLLQHIEKTWKKPNYVIS